MERKGFTLVELLVVIAIIALLMGILMPALARVRQIAFRLVCGTNLSGIGKAMLVYANDYNGELPRSGGRGTIWGSLPNWQATNRWDAYGLNRTDSNGGSANISSSFYLLIKYTGVTPKSFVCKSDSGTSPFKLSEYPNALVTKEIDAWDFGSEPDRHCSYAYHMPYKIAGGGGISYALTETSKPGLAVAGDRNPWMQSPSIEPKNMSDSGFDPDGSRRAIRAGNSIVHQEDGQNLVFMDGHVTFEKHSFCGINSDNIYTYWTRSARCMSSQADIQRGSMPVVGITQSQDKSDSFLVHGGENRLRCPGGRRDCFPADTPVWVDGKLVPILEVVSGQKVGKLDSAAAIAWIEEHGVGVYDCYDMLLESGNSITVVHSHHFLTASGEWVSVENLRSGFQLQSMNGPISIVSVVKRAVPFVGKAYNLKIEGANLYFVGEDGVAAVDCSELPGE